MKKFNAKYSHAISIEDIEQADRTCKLNSYDSQGSNDEGYRYLKVDLQASDEILILEFKKWLQIERKNHGLEIAVKTLRMLIF